MTCGFGRYNATTTERRDDVADVEGGVGVTELAKQGDTDVRRLRFRVLGPVQVLDRDGDTIDIGGPAPRLVLVHLLFNPNRVVSTDALVDAVWGDDPPPTARRSLQSHVARLRAALGGDAGPLKPRRPGYELTVDASHVDLWRSEELVRQARAVLKSDPRQARHLAQLARAEWTGDPLGDLARHDRLLAQRRRLDQLWLDVAELGLDADLAAGEIAPTVERIEALVLDRPEHEPFWARLMTGYYRLGRQGDALRAFQRARTALRDGLGIDPSPALQRLEAAILGQSEDLDDTGVPVCPYKGLASYQRDDADVFYGRDDLVTELLEAVRSASFVVVVGNSGAGKSSALRAGLAKAVEAGAVDGCRTPSVITPGTSPVRTIYQLPPTADLIIVDQFEELFTLTDDEPVRHEFVRLLLARVTERSDRVVISLRADFYGYCTRLAALAPLLARKQVVVGPMTDHELRTVIVKPADNAGLVVDDDLVEAIVTEAGDHIGALPLVSHAMVETWHRRANGHLTLDAYREAGSIGAAIARTAERVYDSLQPAQRSQTERLFLRLVEPGEGTDHARRKVTYTQLEGSSIDRHVVDLLVDARLLTAGADGVEIAHEALIEAWPRLGDWIDDGRDSIRMHRHLTASASAWTELSQDEGELYQGARLSGALSWITDTDPDLSDLERDFIDASVGMSERRLRQQARANRRLRVLVAASLVGVMVATAGIFAAVSKTNDANRRRAQAEAAQMVTTIRGTPQLTQSAVLELAVAADRRASTPATQALLLDTILADPAFIDRGDLDVAPTGSSSTSSTGGVLTGTDSNVLGLALDTTTLEPLKQGLQPAPMVVVNTGSQLLAVVGSPLKVVDVNTRVAVAKFPDVSAHADQVALSPDGTQLAVAADPADSGATSSIAIYNVADQSLRGELEWTNGSALTNILFSPNKRLVFAVVDKSHVAIWDTATGRVVFESPTESKVSVTRIGVAPSNGLIVIGRENGQLELWIDDGAASGRWLSRTIASPHRQAIVWIDFDRTGNRMVSTSLEGSAVAWDTTTGAAVSRQRSFPGRQSLATFFEANSATRLVTIADRHAYEWDTERDGGLFTTINGVDLDARVSGSARLNVVAATGTTVTSYDAAGGGRAVPFEAPRTIRGVAATTDGSRIVVVYDDGSMELRATSGQLVATWGRGLPDSGRRASIQPDVEVAFDRGGHRIAYQNVNHDIELVDDHGHTLDAVALSPERKTVQRLDLSDDGSELVVSTTAGEAIWYDLDGLDAALIATATTGYDAHFVAGGRVVVTGDGAGRVIDPHTRRTTQTFDLGIDATRIAIDGTGHLLATVDRDGFIQLWNADPLVRIGDPFRSRSLSTARPIGFSGDDHYLVVSGEHETTWLDVWMPDWQRIACGLVPAPLSPTDRARYLGTETDATCQ